MTTIDYSVLSINERMIAHQIEPEELDSGSLAKVIAKTTENIMNAIMVDGHKIYGINQELELVYDK